MIRPYDDIQRLTGQIIRCAIEVHRVLGPGLLESPYRDCLIAELKAQSLQVESERHVPIVYKGTRLATDLRLDIMVEGNVIVEVKAVEALHPIHVAQVITYLKLTGCPAGLVLNFNSILLKNGLRRVDHPDRFQKKQQESACTSPVANLKKPFS